MFAEWTKLREVAMHKPGIEVIFALINPTQFLFERSFNLSKARKEHDILRKTLEEEGVKVQRLRKTLTTKIRENSNFRKKIQEIANSDVDDPNYLTELLILRPKINEKGEVIISDPLPNLYFMRDQQITLNNEIIVGKMATRQREREIDVVKLFWNALNASYREINKGKLEGGDFFPMGDFILIGIGNRSDFEGASNLFGFGEVAVVHEPKKEFFHLDMYFNVPSSNTVVGVKRLMEESKVEVYYYGKKIHTTTLYEYIKKKGFNIIEIDEREAKEHLTNFLTIDDGKIISPKESKKFEDFDLIPVNIKNLTGGAGGIHCMTAVIKRY